MSMGSNLQFRLSYDGGQGTPSLVICSKHFYLITIFSLPTSFLQTPSHVKRPSTMNVVVLVDVDCADLWLW